MNGTGNGPFGTIHATAWSSKSSCVTLKNLDFTALKDVGVANKFAASMDVYT